MKKMLAVAVLILGFTVTIAFAQMGGGKTGGMQHEGMGGQQGMMQGQMMGPEMMKDMSGTMNHMMDMMKTMSHTMSHKTVTEHMKMSEMAGVMEDMSVMMHEMSQHMAKGTMSPADSKMMRERINVMQEKMKAVEKSGK